LLLRRERRLGIIGHERLRGSHPLTRACRKRSSPLGGLSGRRAIRCSLCQALQRRIESVPRRTPIANARLIELDAHINDEVFAEAALAVLDEWVAEGRVPKGLR
jgi:LSD1 subclass zinc finger protein